MADVKQNYGQKALVQFEDFAYRHIYPSREVQGAHLVVNDDIQGTATMVLAGLIAGLKFVGGTLADHKFLFYGAGEIPIILAQSNPTSKYECTAEQAYSWSEGRAIFGSGSPFDPVKYNDKLFVPAQANNANIFPWFGLGVVISGAIRVKDDTKAMYFYNEQ